MRHKDITVARIAAAQHGVITLEQLATCGLDRSAVRRRVVSGRLHPLHRAVYAVGHPAVPLAGQYLAAALAAGRGAVVSHRAAAHLLRLLRGAAPAAEVLVPMDAPRRVPGVVVHRTRVLAAAEVSQLDGVPITTVPRTLVDLSATLSEAELARACHEAWVIHRTRPERVAAVLSRAPNRPGTARLRAVLFGDHRLTLSRLEREFVAVLEAARLPLPETNRVVGRDRVDCRWPSRRLVVELDSYRFHATRQQWDEDLRRERRARAAGNEHRRYSWADVVEDPEPMLAELRLLLD